MTKISLTPLLLVATTILATAAPIAPINAGAYNFTDTSARISFKDISNNETGFRIEHVQNGNAVLATELSTDPTSIGYRYVNLTGLNPSTLYTIDIIAFDDNGSSTALRKSFRTLAALNIPTAPINAGATDITGSTTSKRLSWLDTANNELGFKIYNGGVLLDTIPANAMPNEYAYSTVTGLTPCSLYTVDIVAYNGDGESDKLTKSFMTLGCMTEEDIPLAPSNLGVYNNTDTSVRLSFMDNANNEDGFRVIYTNTDTNATDTLTLPRNRFHQEYNYTNIPGLVPDTLYTLTVEAYNGAGEGVSDVKHFRTLP